MLLLNKIQINKIFYYDNIGVRENIGQMLFIAELFGQLLINPKQLAHNVRVTMIID